MSRLQQAQPIAIVAQVINELEAQGLLMLFDQEDKVAKRLTGDLIAAGVVQDPIESVPPPSNDTSDSQ